jgi:hypothetical protein
MLTYSEADQMKLGGIFVEKELECKLMTLQAEGKRDIQYSEATSAEPIWNIIDHNRK